MSTELTESQNPAECVDGVAVLRFFGGSEVGMCFQFSTDEGFVVLSANELKERVRVRRLNASRD